LLGQIYVSQGKLDEARREFEQVSAHDPKSVPARTMTAMIAHTQDKVDDARLQYERILQTDPRAAVAANNLAWMLADSEEDLDRALRLAQVARASDPRSAEFSDTVGWVYIKKRLPELAVAAFQASVDRQPANPTFHYHLGLAYAGIGEREKARTSLSRALALNPNFPEAPDASTLLGTLR
jgi:Tfp pilus assembly protein PilF